jgi:hypothetical protein
MTAPSLGRICSAAAQTFHALDQRLQVWNSQSDVTGTRNCINVDVVFDLGVAVKASRLIIGADYRLLIHLSRALRSSSITRSVRDRGCS